MAKAEKAAGRGVHRRAGRARPRREAAGAGQGHGAADRGRGRRDGAHAVERRRGVAQADRLQERSGRASAPMRRAASSLASEADFQEASLATALVGVGGHGRPQPGGFEQAAGRQDRAGVADDWRATRTASTGSASPRDLETALKLNYLVFTAPNLTREAFELLKRRLTSALENQAQNPGYVFNEKVEQVNTSNHYSAKALTVADVGALDLERMQRFYRERFANAADFTYFIVGAFTVDEITPLLEQWVATLPSTGKKASTFRDMGVRFPAQGRRRRSPQRPRAARPDRDLVLRRHQARRARDAPRARRGVAARHPAARHPARGARRHLRRQRVVRQLAAADRLRRR